MTAAIPGTVATKTERLKQVRLSDTGRAVLTLPKVQLLLERMLEGDKIRDAAIAAGLRINRARRLLRDPAVRREYLRQCEQLCENERARNVLLRRTVRDRGLEPDAPAALAKVALEAARQLDGDDQQGGITINGGQNVIAGYVIKLPAPGEGPRAITNRSSRPAPGLPVEDV